MTSNNITVKEISNFSEIEKIILEFKNTYFLRPITTDDYRSIFINKHLKNGHFLAEYHNNTPVGFISFYCNNIEQKKAFVTSLSISDNLGFLKGKTLIRLMRKGIQIASDAEMQTVGLEVDTNNFKAIKLYKHLGFEFVSNENDTKNYMEIRIDKLKKATS